MAKRKWPIAAIITWSVDQYPASWMSCAEWHLLSLNSGNKMRSRPNGFDLFPKVRRPLMVAYYIRVSWNDGITVQCHWVLYNLLHTVQYSRCTVSWPMKCSRKGLEECVRTATCFCLCLQKYSPYEETWTWVVRRRYSCPFARRWNTRASGGLGPSILHVSGG